MIELRDFLSATCFIAFTSVVLLIWHSVRKQRYWKERGIPFVKPLPILGNILDRFFKPIHFVDAERYFKYGPIYGSFEGNTPILSVADLKLIRNIYVKDFQYFPNRWSLKTGDEIAKSNLIFLDGEDWKRVRSIITPTFSTGKLKRLLSIFKDCAKSLVQNMKSFSDKKEPINAKSLYGALTMDVIASALFSTKLDSHNDPRNKFVENARKRFGSKVSWRQLIFILFPRLRGFIPKIFRSKNNPFFNDLLFQIIDERNRTGQTKNDFLQLLLDTAKETAKEEKSQEFNKENDILRNYGHDDAFDQKADNTTTKKRLTRNELVAQSVTFFLAGYETTSSTLSFVSYCLAMNQDIQEKLHQEIIDCLKETNGELTYEVIQKMKYMDNVISETLRMYPPSGRAVRKAKFDYKIAEIGITIPKGMLVIIPFYCLQNDPKIFPNPEKFDPDRFTAEERAKRDPYAFTPFGAGPRICIGMRFALLELKMTLVYVISHFKIKTCPQTQIPPKLNANDFGLLQPNDVLLRMEPRENVLLLK